MKKKTKQNKQTKNKPAKTNKSSIST